MSLRSMMSLMVEVEHRGFLLVECDTFIFKLKHMPSWLTDDNLGVRVLWACRLYPDRFKERIDKVLAVYDGLAVVIDERDVRKDEGISLT